VARTKKQSKRRVRTPDDRMTLVEHLAELRNRIVKAFLAVALGTIIVFLFYDLVLGWLREPYDQVCAANPEFGCDGDLLIVDPLDGFATRMRVAGYGGLVLALPIVLWQLWRFVTPGLHPNEKRYAVPFIVVSTLLFLFGAAVAYFTLPRAIEFLVAFSGEGITANFVPGRYIRLVTLMMLAFGSGFLFPVLLVFLQLVGVLTPQRLLSWWRQVIVGTVVLAAVITPSGDPISLLALFVPLTIFYLIAVGIGFLVARRRRKSGEKSRAREQDAAAGAGTPVGDEEPVG
jgi:sec-independent protein translocase protein TatC